MNNSNFEDIIKAYRKVSMTPEEKREVFKQSMLVIEKIEAVSLAHSDKKNLQHFLNPDISTETISTGVSYQKTKRQVILSWASYIKRRQFVPALMASFLLLFIGSTSMMAEEALPGDSLYSFKVSVNESVRDLAAVTDEAKAKLAVEITSRRLQEAAVLSAQGKLDEKSKKILQDQFVKKADEVKNRVASLVSKNNLNAAQEVVVDFESALQTHELILSSLSLVADGNASSSVSEVAQIDNNTVAIAPIATSTVQQSALVVVSTSTTKSTHPEKQVSGLLATVKSELDSAKTSRIDIQEKVQANLTTHQATSSSAEDDMNIIISQSLIDANVKEITFALKDIETTLGTYNFSEPTKLLVEKRFAIATSTLGHIADLEKEHRFVEASKEIRKILHSISEIETLLKLEKNSSLIDLSAVISTLSADEDIATSTSASSTVQIQPTPTP